MTGLGASHYVGTILGIPVRIMYALYIIVGVMAFQYLAAGSLIGTIAILCVPVFVYLHEMGHSLAARNAGQHVHGILLHPFGGFAETSGGSHPGDEIVIALAGPMVSLILAMLGFVLSNLLGGPFGGSLGLFFQIVFSWNLMLAIFNLLPIFPMDGGRVAMAAVTLYKDEATAIRWMKIISPIGFALLVLYGLVRLRSGDFGGVSMVVIAVILYLNGSQELAMRSGYSGYSGYTGADRGYADSQNYSTRGGTGRLYANYEARQEKKKQQPGPIKRFLNGFSARAAAKKKEKDDALKAEVDRILDKVKQDGLNSLTPEERDTLNRASQQLRDQ